MSKEQYVISLRTYLVIDQQSEVDDVVQALMETLTELGYTGDKLALTAVVPESADVQAFGTGGVDALIEEVGDSAVEWIVSNQAIDEQ